MGQGWICRVRDTKCSVLPISWHVRLQGKKDMKRMVIAAGLFLAGMGAMDAAERIKSEVLNARVLTAETLSILEYADRPVGANNRVRIEADKGQLRIYDPNGKLKLGIGIHHRQNDKEYVGCVIFYAPDGTEQTLTLGPNNHFGLMN